MKNKEVYKELLSNLDYVLVCLEKANTKVNMLEDKLYLEITKAQVIDYLNKVYIDIKRWIKYAYDKDFKSIKNEYRQVESIVSELELCFVDYEKLFNMNGISYSIYIIGKILSDF